MLPASNNIVPKLGRGGWIPNPSQLNIISVPIRAPIPIETVTTIGDITLGNKWINNIANLDIFIKKPEDISETALQSIKKIKAIPRGDKVEFEIEMIDKVRILQLLAKSSGLLDRQAESEKPSVIEIQMVGPDGKSK